MDGGHDILIQIECREDDHADGPPLGGHACDVLRGGDAVHAWHAHIHQHDVRRELFRQPDCLIAVRDLSHNLHIGL